MDTWFTTEPMIRTILSMGLNVIGMVKQLNQRYTYQDKAYTLPQLQILARVGGARNIFCSLCVTTTAGIPLTMVFVRNRTRKGECLNLLGTDYNSADTEIECSYGTRWSM